MKKRTFLLALAVAAFSGPFRLALADPIPLTQNRDIHINVSNDAGALYGDPLRNDTYWINGPAAASTNCISRQTAPRPGSSVR